MNICTDVAGGDKCTCMVLHDVKVLDVESACAVHNDEVTENARQYSVTSSIRDAGGTHLGAYS